MVIPDADFSPPSPPPKSSPRETLAPPLHRLAAVVLDVGVVLTPVYVLLAAPIKRALTARVLTGANDAESLGLLLFVLALTLGLAYQIFAHYRFGQTLGKRVFGIYVEGTRGNFGASCARSFAWVTCLGLGGWPFLAVFAHPRRRPIHDRVAETNVLAERGGVGAPDVWSRALARTVNVLGALVLAIVGVVALHDVFRERLEITRAAVTGSECEVVSRNVADAGDDDHARLRMGLTLYAAGLADRSCLDSEIEREVAVQTAAAPVTYLAQAFVNADDAEISNAYLNRVCLDASGGPECAMSRLVGHWSAAEWDEVDRVLAAAPKGEVYLDVWAARHHVKRARFAEALADLDRLVDRPEVAEFTLDQRVRVLYGVNDFDGARVAFKQALPALDPEPGTELGAYACVQEFARGCGAAREVACDRVATLESTPEATATLRLAQVRKLECAGEANVDYMDLADGAPDSVWRNLYVGSARVNTADRGGAVRAFNRIVTDDDAPDLARVEAVRRLGMIADATELRDLARAWSEWDPSVAWAQSGNLLFDRLVARRDLRTAAEVAAILDQHRLLAPAAAARWAAWRTPEAELRRPASAGDE